MTFRELYNTGTKMLEAAGIEEAALDAWYLLEYVTGISRAVFLADSGNAVADDAEEKYLKLTERRAERIPLQHITGVQEFMGLEFVVNEHVLIPRQDTEILVETALEKLKEQLLHAPEQVRFLDMCTGSGCILLSVLRYADREYDDKEITGIGADVSPDALRVAKQNGENLNIKADWTETDLFDRIEGTFDMILSNPPYIPSEVIETLQPEVREHDPRLALDGKADGLYFYRKIIEESRTYLKPGGWLIFEIGAEQGEAVSSYMKECGYRSVAVKKDLAGLDRVVYGVYDKIADEEEKGTKRQCLTD